MREELVEAVLRVVEAIPPGRAATYGMIARAVGTSPRVVGRIMHDWGGGVPWWRVVSAHGTYPTTIRDSGFAEWEKEGMPHDVVRGKLLLDQCVVEQEWLDCVGRIIVDNLRNSTELSD
ncbi:DNA-binding protein [Schaalia meyeri]|uniref:MGMT family protein n=1 Tax=Schaalia meyeri TaxID=52773 RepID=UPI0006830F81|nr:MGMT family protein [Schaalia meyeri]AKU65349.1 DNA-binding protein [Schaalia meyeri]OFQ23757.1 DNA-binding protein [Actinomyces sp. HMSC062G12]